jgi:hypothetical protein
MMTFCDGRVQFIAQTIDYLVYQHIMTPDSEAAGEALTMNDDPNLPGNLRTSVFYPKSIE